MDMAWVVKFSDGSAMDFDTHVFRGAQGTSKSIDGFPYLILKALTATRDVLSRETLIAACRKEDAGEVIDRAVDNHISFLRKAIPALQSPETGIRTVRGIGYQYMGPRPCREEPPENVNSDRGLAAPIADPLEKPPARPDSGNPDREPPSPGLRQRRWKSQPLTLDQALRQLEGWMDQAVACVTEEVLTELRRQFRTFFDVRCLHFAPLELQQLHNVLCGGLEYFAELDGPIPQALWSLLDRQEFSLHVQILEAKLQLCDEGLAAARRANQIGDVERFSRMRERFLDDLDETCRIRDNSRQLTL